MNYDPTAPFHPLGRVIPFSLPGIFFYIKGGGSYNQHRRIPVLGFCRVAVIAFGFLAIVMPPPPCNSSPLTCNAQVKGGLHQIKVEAVFLHLEPGTDHIWISTKAQLANGPVMVSASAQGHPVAYHIYIDGAEAAYCGSDPREIFSGDFETGDLSQWSYSGLRGPHDPTTKGGEK